MVAEQLIGRGIIEFSHGLAHRLFPDLLKLDDCTLQGELKAQGVFDELHKRLHLPKHYHIVGVFLHVWSRSPWQVVVESPDIPLPTNEYGDYPFVSLQYTRQPDGTALLLKIEIQENRFDRVLDEHSWERVLKP